MQKSLQMSAKKTAICLIMLKYMNISISCIRRQIYYSRDKRTYTDETVTDGIVSSTYHCQVFKLYTIDLTSDNLTPTLIDDEVLKFYVYNDMLYYTAFDYKFLAITLHHGEVYTSKL